MKKISVISILLILIPLVCYQSLAQGQYWDNDSWLNTLNQSTIGVTTNWQVKELTDFYPYPSGYFNFPSINYNHDNNYDKFLSIYHSNWRTPYSNFSSYCYSPYCWDYLDYGKYPGYEKYFYNWNYHSDLPWMNYSLHTTGNKMSASQTPSLDDNDCYIDANSPRFPIIIESVVSYTPPMYKYFPEGIIINDTQTANSYSCTHSSSSYSVCNSSSCNVCGGFTINDSYAYLFNIAKTYWDEIYQDCNGSDVPFIDNDNNDFVIKIYGSLD